jgi:hypothetical protein
VKARQVIERDKLGVLTKMAQGGQGVVYQAPNVKTKFASSMVYNEYKPHTVAEIDFPNTSDANIRDANTSDAKIRAAHYLRPAAASTPDRAHFHRYRRLRVEWMGFGDIQRLSR